VALLQERRDQSLALSDSNAQALHLLLLKAIRASSVEFDQTADYTLPSQRGFWSSAPNESPDSDEFIDYELLQPLCVIRAFAIQVMRSALPYPPRRVQLAVYHQDPALVASPHYLSPEYPCLNSDHALYQRFSLPEDRLVVGGFVRVHLLGKHNPHFVQGKSHLYYTCLTRMEVIGSPVTALRSQLLQRSLVADAILRWNLFKESSTELLSLSDQTTRALSSLERSFSSSVDQQRRVRPRVGGGPDEQQQVAADTVFMQALLSMYTQQQNSMLVFDDIDLFGGPMHTSDGEGSNNDDEQEQEQEEQATDETVQLSGEDHENDDDTPPPAAADPQSRSRRTSSFGALWRSFSQSN